MLDLICGTWTSPVIPIANVLGLVNVDTTLTTAGSFQYQISFDGGTFVGPDGTAATFFADGDYIDYSADGSTTAQIRVELCGGGSEVAYIGLEDQLLQIFHLDSVSVSGDEAALRVYPTLNDSYIEYRSNVGADSYDVDVDVAGASPQINATSGTITNPATVFTSQPYSIIFNNVSTQTSSLVASIIDEDGVRQEAELTFNIAS